MSNDVSGWIGRIAVDRDGDKLGEISEIYTDDETGQPEWATVTTGLFGTKRSFVPLQGATASGDDLRVAYTKAQVKDAPKVDPDGHLDEADERLLFEHYSMDWGGYGDGRGVASADAASASGRSRAGQDDAMTRSEEELRVGTTRRDAGRARLRKYVVTEEQTVRVPVEREVARLETEPITDANRARAMDGPDITESSHEVVLSEEEVVVDKVTVPKERVRLATDTVTEQRQVTEDVRKERIEADGDVVERR